MSAARSLSIAGIYREHAEKLGPRRVSTVKSNWPITKSSAPTLSATSTSSTAIAFR